MTIRHNEDKRMSDNDEVSRRGVVGAGAGIAALLGLSKTAKAAGGKGPFEVTKTEAECAGTSPLDREKRKGVFHCAGCDLPLFDSETKYDSGTGWPSFWKPIDKAIGTSEDRSFFSLRIEVHCRRCGGHLGHVFEDGPKPTGLRYCMNGVAMTFKPTA
jgi:peptide-methionine (R)-S-oxide reductase